MLHLHLSIIRTIPGLIPHSQARDFQIPTQKKRKFLFTFKDDAKRFLLGIKGRLVGDPFEGDVIVRGKTGDPENANSVVFAWLEFAGERVETKKVLSVGIPVRNVLKDDLERLWSGVEATF